MTEQPLLFQDNGYTATSAVIDRPAPYQSGSATSRAGARRIERTDRSNLQTLIMRVLHSRGAHGATIEELAKAVSELRGRLTKETSICGRIAGSNAELSRWVIKSGNRRPNRSGVAADVYVHRLYTKGLDAPPLRVLPRHPPHSGFEDAER